MKTIVAALILLNISAYSQQFRLGGSVDFLAGNKFIDWEVAPSLIVEYSFQNLPLSVRGVTRLYLSQINGSEFTSGYTFTSSNIGVTVNYYPIKWAIEPYVGLGIFYNSNGITQSGNTSPEYNGTIRALKIENNFSSEIAGGVKFSANSPINFIVEVTQTFNKPGKLITTDFDTREILKEDDLNFNSLFLKIGLLFLL